MSTFSLKYCINRMIHWLWLAVVVALVFCGGYYIKEKSAQTEIDSEIVEFGLKSEDNPYAVRYAFLMLEMSDEAQKEYRGNDLQAYKNGVGTYVGSTLSDTYTEYQVYSMMMEQFPELDYSHFSFNDVKAIYGVRLENMRLQISACPPELSNDQIIDSNKMSREEMVKLEARIRDTVFDYLIRIAEDTAAMNVPDFSVSVGDERVAEAAAFERYYASGVGASDAGVTSVASVSKKKLLIFFLLGGVLVEGVVFIAALFNETVKDEEDLQSKTNLSVVQVLKKAYRKQAEDKNCKAVAANILVHAETSKLCLIMATDAELEKAKEITNSVASEIQAIGKNTLTLSAEELGKAQESEKKPAEWEKADVVLCAVPSVAEDTSGILLTAGQRVILVVRQKITKYSVLRKMASALSQVDANVCGAILSDYYKGKFEL